MELPDAFNHPPISRCICGHTGDGSDSDHDGIIGHGACTVVGCGCRKFTWKEFLPTFEEMMGKNKSGKNLEAS